MTRNHKHFHSSAHLHFWAQWTHQEIITGDEFRFNSTKRTKANRANEFGGDLKGWLSSAHFSSGWWNQLLIDSPSSFNYLPIFAMSSDWSFASLSNNGLLIIVTNAWIMATIWMSCTCPFVFPPWNCNKTGTAGMDNHAGLQKDREITIREQSTRTSSVRIMRIRVPEESKCISL